jgi:hypothetical protein
MGFFAPYSLKQVCIDLFTQLKHAPFVSSLSYLIRTEARTECDNALAIAALANTLPFLTTTKGIIIAKLLRAIYTG